jgi:thermostable 8-oxoguanine DNA glycosylase
MAINVDPFDIPKKMGREQLEYWIIFGICVANKSAKQTEIKVKAMLDGLHRFASPFAKIRIELEGGNLMQHIKFYKLGQYKRIYRAFKEVIELNLDTLSVESLESVHGIGPKTARMIMLYYDPLADCVPLDTHVLKFLKKQGYDAPKNTPSAGKKYNELELAFQTEAKKAGKTVRELDTEVWLFYAKK